MPTLFHVHDPMCSWCWGYRRTWDQLRSHLDEKVKIVNVLGGLAPDTDEPMPPEQQRAIAGYWNKVAAATGAEFNFDFWTACQPRRSTYPACRAVLAARAQGAEQAMIDAIQQAYYLRAMNPSDNDTLSSLADELDLDCGRFNEDLNAEATQEKLQQEFALRRRLGVQTFPSLVLEYDNVNHPIAVNYREYRHSLGEIGSLL